MVCKLWTEHYSCNSLKQQNWHIYSLTYVKITRGAKHQILVLVTVLIKLLKCKVLHQSPRKVDNKDDTECRKKPSRF